MPLSRRVGSPGVSEQARNSIGGTPSSVRSIPKTSWTTPISKSPGRGGTTMATVCNVMPRQYGRKLAESDIPATRGKITALTKLLP